MLACRLDDSRGNGSAHAMVAPQPAGRADDAEQEAAAGGSSGGAAEKLLRGLQKKLRQGEALQERQSQGDALTGPELEKLSKVPSWCVASVHHSRWIFLSQIMRGLGFQQALSGMCCAGKRR